MAEHVLDIAIFGSWRILEGIGVLEVIPSNSDSTLRVHFGLVKNAQRDMLVAE